MEQNNKIYQVSNQTAMFVAALKEAQTLYSSVYEACINMYGESQADEAMEKFNERYFEMNESIYDLMKASIIGNIGTEGNTEI